jgi:hypothetical protein
MNGGVEMFDFEPYGKLIGEYFDTDFVDIRRQVAGMSELAEVYSNIPCHVEFVNADNPDPTPTDAPLILTGLRIHANTDADLQNGDFLVAKKCNSRREILKVYRGVCGQPLVSMGRQSVVMTMRQVGGDNEDVTPVPPTDRSKITVNYLDIEGRTVEGSTVYFADIGEPKTIAALDVVNHDYVKAVVNGVETTDSKIVIYDNEPRTHTIEFIYERTEDYVYFRLLVNGMFKRDNGSMGFGLHLFGRTKYTSDGDMLTVGINSLNHPETGRQSLTAGRRLKLFPSEQWATIESIAQKDGAFVLETTPYTPTEQEAAAYVAAWYD